MGELNLKWWQIKELWQQIKAATEASKLGATGKLTMDSGCIVEWDGSNVKLEIPEDEDPRTDREKAEEVLGRPGRLTGGY